MSNSSPDETIVNNPKISSIVDSVPNDVMNRRKIMPSRCKVFTSPVTALEIDAHYRFKIDREAGRQLPDIIGNPVQRVVAVENPDPALKERYHRPRKIGIVFSGGPAPGGHNVIAGLYDAARQANDQNEIFGFLMGPDGIIEGEFVPLTGEKVDAYRNLGGFGMIKTGRAKIDNKKKMDLSRKTCKKIGLDALVIVGGDDSNTNAAFLAQEMFADKIQVIGVPKTIDGDIQVRDADGRVLCAMSFGFHTAAMAFSNAIASLCTDSSSDVKYWHICKVMGRVASHLALETALQTHANMTLIGEELADYVDKERLNKADGVDYTAYGMTLRRLSRVICEGIVRRAAVGKNYGVIVIPEGILEFINEIQIFIIKLNTIIADYNATHDTDFHTAFPQLEDKLEYLRRLARHSREDQAFSIWNTRDDDLFNDIPEFFQEGLLMERDSHGNFQFSQVETDKVLMGLVTDYLKILREEGLFRVGIESGYFQKTLREGGLDPDFYGPILFENYGDRYLLMRGNIISVKTLTQMLVKEGVMDEDDEISGPISKIYQKSVPKFKSQIHFYGYDGRGNDPTWFDSAYAYNLGLTVFSLIANGTTGQMAAIRNLEKPFDQWTPIGIPIAPLMHLEDRKGKLTLVLEKSLVDVNAMAFKTAKAFREKWLAATFEADEYRHPGPVQFDEKSEEIRPLTLLLNALEQSES